MAETIRAVLAETDALIARVRAELGLPAHDDPTETADDTALALSIEAAWDNTLEHLMYESRLADAAKHFRAQWPALVQWRDRVLANQRRQPPQIVAAAYESLALECLLAGEYHLSARAQQAAIDVIRARGPKIVPIRPAEPSAVAQSA